MIDHDREVERKARDLLEAASLLHSGIGVIVPREALQRLSAEVFAPGVLRRAGVLEGATIKLRQYRQAEEANLYWKLECEKARSERSHYRGECARLRRLVGVAL